MGPSQTLRSTSSSPGVKNIDQPLCFELKILSREQADRELKVARCRLQCCASHFLPNRLRSCLWSALEAGRCATCSSNPLLPPWRWCRNGRRSNAKRGLSWSHRWEKRLRVRLCWRNVTFDFICRRYSKPDCRCRWSSFVCFSGLLHDFGLIRNLPISVLCLLLLQLFIWMHAQCGSLFFVYMSVRTVNIMNGPHCSSLYLIYDKTNVACFASLNYLVLYCYY